MKRSLIYFFCVLSFTLFAQQKAKVHVTFTNSYCGGARPTPEMEAEQNKPKDLSDFAILLEGKKRLKVKTDSLGNFLLPLKASSYKVYLTSKVNANLYANYNPSCSKMLHTPYGKLVIDPKQKEYTLHLHFPCNPCEPNNRP